MGNALFIANIELNSTEGIYKKVCAQSDAVGKSIGNCDLISRKGKFAVVKKYLEDEQKETNSDFYDYIIKLLLRKKFDFVYIRHMIPNFKLLKILKIAKKNDVKIYYEIPTYPYFGEQLKASRKKYRAVGKILLDIIFWPIIYYYITKLVVIRSNSKTHHFKKMVEMTNGVKTNNIKSKDYGIKKDKNIFSMVTVGTLYPYHGYDRIIRGLAECDENVGNIKIEFHIIGESQTISELHEEADRLNLKNVFFHGRKTTEEMNKMFDKFDVGLGCLALHRRNADIDTTLKIIEYYCRGIPVVTSGKSPMDKYNTNYTIGIEDSEKPVKISEIIEKYNKISLEEKKEISDCAKKIFDWDFIINSIL